MNVLGIETSCDETSLAVVRDGRKILSNKVSSSLKLHQKYGGVVPEIASRMQLEAISFVAEEAVKDAGIGLAKIDLVCVTSGPGLPGSLLVGIAFAKSLTLVLGVPLVGVNHVYSHLYANFLQGGKPKFPFVSLVVSGGHTSLFYLRGFRSIETLGQTQDDACGEAFDKVAKILGLGYPGGPLIERLSKKGDARKIKFSCSGTKGALDFSFSGIKTAVLYHMRKARDDGRWTMDEKRNTAASFQETVIDTLINKSFLACKKSKVSSLVVGGGVAANARLREKFYAAGKLKGIDCYFPARNLCIDNAAMVAGMGYQLFKRGVRSSLDLSLEAN